MEVPGKLLPSYLLGLVHLIVSLSPFLYAYLPAYAVIQFFFYDSRWQALSETDEISFYQGGEDGVVDTGFNLLQICADVSNSECDGYDLWRTLRCYQEKGTGTW